MRKNIALVKRAARRYRKSPEPLLANQLLSLIEIDRSTENLVRRVLATPTLDWIFFKRELRDVFATHASPQMSPAVARSIELLDPRQLVPDSGRWPDTPTARLVTSLIPIWGEVTGRTAALTSSDSVGDEKKFLFYDWLNGIFSLLDAGVLSQGTVLDVVRTAKSKNPAPVWHDKF